ncbi:GNAT family N-acetyltransferase [Sulfuriferula sp. AH1]|uniref:GNAT family N-acetyltransferase n=1 Tax=Sulfuriferula sp. AH1 TaxID=1985873 RepID=UPI000B3BA3D6|nr:GNAT family N-acetyltransferase [Sulfuriferula sp. AH1]ARU32206.1 GNAT family N-acetyltransferase [Sulfuriferula sp. AH1]
MPPLTFRLATAQDIDPLADLVNSAYRGDSSRAGWTTEANLLGGQRTDSDEIRSLLETTGSTILIGMQGKDIIASLHLQQDGTRAYLGMFAIRPDLQGAGIGKHCLQQAEHHARQRWGASTMLMTVITLRHELIAYYERRGYRHTGILKPFPTSPRFGIPKVDGLELMVLEKVLDTTD